MTPRLPWSPAEPRETWLPIPGYDGLYEVSDQGRIRSWRIRGGRSGRRRDVPFLRKTFVNRNGYLTLALRGQDGRKTRSVHVLVALTFIGQRPDGMEIRHLDGNRQNNAASNLSYGTRSENMLDQVRHGVHANASKTHCPRGHALEGDNLLIWRSGARRCRTCTREQHAAAHLNRKRQAVAS